jgi:hypothetical protein
VTGNREQGTVSEQNRTEQSREGKRKEEKEGS